MLRPAAAWLITGLATLGAFVAPDRVEAQWQATVAAEGGAFGGGAPSAGLPPVEAGLVLNGSVSREWADGRYLFRAAPFVRWDPAGRRSRVDLRELGLAVLGDRWELRVGVGEVFWGAVESRRLVDGVNQRDLVDSGEDYVPIGQLMVDLTAIRRWGTIDVLILPWFRERTFDGHAGLLWSPLPVDASRAVYGPGAGSWRLDWALRWSHTLGPLDMGVSHLLGNLREPGFELIDDGAGRSAWAPRYDLGGQTGLDAQLATGRIVWKVEALTADPEPGRYLSAAGGLEYGIGDYLALFVEYAWDSRGRAATTSFGDDFVVGGRLFVPDGQLRLLTYVDRRTLNTVLSLGGDWRLSGATTLSLQVGAFLGDSSTEPPLGRRQQTGVSLRLSRYF